MFKDYKILVKDEEESKEVQEMLFKLGYKWASGDTVVLSDIPKRTYIYTSKNGEITYDSFKETFEWDWSKELTLTMLKNMVEGVGEQGVKYDSDKLEYSLLPKGVLNSVIKVLGFGSKKYSKDNWMKVDNPKERYYNAAQRHINQWWEGEKYDSETSENHLAHAMCCLMFLLWFDNQEDTSKSVAAKLAKALGKEGSL